MKKILIIEDEKILADMYKEKFEMAGFKVFWAADAEEGLIMVKKEKPALILLDILLPRGNGISFLEKVKKDPDVSSIPTVAFSNYDDPQTKEKARKLEAKDYLIKTNFTPEEIVTKIKEYLN